MRVVNVVVGTLAMTVALSFCSVLISSPAQAASDPCAKAVAKAMEQGLTSGKNIPLGDAKHVRVSGNSVRLSNGDGGFIGLGLPIAAAKYAISDANSGEAVRALNIVTSHDGPTKFNYVVALPNGAQAQLLANGSIRFWDGHKVIGGIKKPWAFDARGNEVKTWFTLDGSNLTQTVAPKPSSVYPIVSDPSVYLRHGWTTASWYFSKAFTRSMAKKLGRYANASNAAIAGAFTLACAPISGPVAIVCGALGAVFGGFAIDQVLEASRRYVCIRVRVANIPPFEKVLGIYVDASKYCKAS